MGCSLSRRPSERYILSPDAESRSIISPVTTRWLLLLLAPLLLRPAAPMSVVVVDPLTRVRPKDVPRGAAEARVKAARNETEGFQIVVRAGDKGVKSGTIQVSDLQGEGGRVLARQNVA